jgi:putative ABC transport system substrate-binding protein
MIRPCDRMKRREVIALLGGAAAWPLAARAQQPALPVIGILHSASAESYAHLMSAFWQSLGTLGYVEHKTIAVEYRWADNNMQRLTEFGADLARRNLKLIVAAPGTAALVAKRSTSEIPIVFGVGNDPVSAGLVASLNRPGGNATGVYYFTTALSAKRLELARQLVPRARKVTLLVNSDAAFGAQTATNDADAASAKAGLDLEVVNATNNREIDAAFEKISAIHTDVLLINPSPLFTSRRVQLVSLAMRDRLPTIYPSREFTETGGLISYGANLSEEYRKMGLYAGRILNGTRPGEIPVEQSTRFELIINLQTAKTLRLDVPSQLSALADEVIE